MNRRNGYVLLSLLLFFTVLVLSSTVTVLQHDTRLTRYSEEDLKHNVDAIRRGIDLFRFKYPNPAVPPRQDLELYIETASQNFNDPDLVASSVASITLLLARESFIRARIATDSMHWIGVKNYINNPSFEDDSGSRDYGIVGSWRGNFTAGDGTPDGWKLTDLGAEQYLNLSGPATYVISFWARGTTATAKARLGINFDATSLQVTADNQEWKRYYQYFQLPGNKVVRVEIARLSGNSGDVTYIDGIMLEKWNPPAGLPAGTPPSPSAFTPDFNLTPARSDEALQKSIFDDLKPAVASPESFSRWFNW